MCRLRLAKLSALVLLTAACAALLLAGRLADRRAYARSTGPDPGHTRAPDEDPEGCRVCHLPDGAPSGTITIAAPQPYVPGQIYHLPVTVENAPPSGRRGDLTKNA